MISSSYRAAVAISMTLLLSACGNENTASKVASPGAPESATTQVLEAGANTLQHKAPLAALNAYLDGFHFYSGDQQAQMEAHHYCGHLNDDLIQCAIFDGNGGDAKLMGVEYIVSAKLFATLPENEKHLWHSHVHEVRSGQLLAPGIPAMAETVLMKKLASTYGKTWHTWHTDRRDTLPLGIPMLMMGFTADGQARADMVSERDRRFDIDSAEIRGRRADIPYPPADPSADAWRHGIVEQLQLVDVEVSPHASDSNH